MKVPKGIEQHFPGDVVLLLLRTIYGLKQAAKSFWSKLIEVLKDMRYSESSADPCFISVDFDRFDHMVGMDR